MNRESALHALSAAVPADRLEAARYLQFWAVPADIPELRTALQREPVGWVRSALEATLRRLGDATTRVVDLDDLVQDEADSANDLVAIARAKMARTVVHELEPIAGAIEYYADLEMPNFEKSRTKQNLDRLARTLRALEKLAKVSGRPKLSRVDLRPILIKVVEGERVSYAGEVVLEGPRTASVLTDADFIELIVRNAVRNSCEAVQQTPEATGSVTVLFGETDREMWVSVIDSGVGIPAGSTEQLFDLGTSTKEDHLGMGLALAREAAQALGGSIRLQSMAGETRFDLTVRYPEEGDAA